MLCGCDVYVCVSVSVRTPRAAAVADPLLPFSLSRHLIEREGEGERESVSAVAFLSKPPAYTHT